MIFRKASGSVRFLRSTRLGRIFSSPPSSRLVADLDPRKEVPRKSRVTRGRCVQVNCLIVNDTLEESAIACTPVNTQDNVDTVKSSLGIPEDFLLATLKPTLPANGRDPILKDTIPHILKSANRLSRTSDLTITPSANSRSTPEADKILSPLSGNSTFLEAGLGRPHLGQLHLVASPLQPKQYTEKDLYDFLRSSPGLPYYEIGPSSSQTSRFDLRCTSHTAREIESPYFIETDSQYVPEYLNQHFGQSGSPINRKAFERLKTELAALSSQSVGTRLVDYMQRLKCATLPIPSILS